MAHVKDQVGVIAKVKFEAKVKVKVKVNTGLRFKTKN